MVAKRSSKRKPPIFQARIVKLRGEPSVSAAWVAMLRRAL